MAAIQVCRFKLVQHSPSSPDLAPLDNYLYPKMNKKLIGHHFDSNDDFIAAVERFLEGQDTDEKESVWSTTAGLNRLRLYRASNSQIAPHTLMKTKLSILHVDKFCWRYPISPPESFTVGLCHSQTNWWSCLIRPTLRHFISIRLTCILSDAVVDTLHRCFYQPLV